MRMALLTSAVLELSLLPERGNASARYFPHSGYLGLSPVTLSGRVVTKIPQLAQSLDVREVVLTVKCLEVRSAGTFGSDVENVLWEKAKRIWSAPAGSEYLELGEWQYPWKISIPPDAVDRACSSQTLKEWKACWRVEVVIHHRPIPYVGHTLSKSYALNLQNHRLPSIPPLSPPSAMTIGADSTVTQIFIAPPHGAFGPGDTIPIAFHAQPEDSSVSVKRVTVILERLVEVLDDKAYNSMSILQDILPDPRHGGRLSSLFRRSASPGNYTRLQDSLSPSPEVDGRVISHKLVEETCEVFTPGSGGTFWGSVNMTIPKRGDRWDFGETFRSKLVDIRYELRLKVTIKMGKRREYGVGGIPITLVGTSAQQRTEAIAAIPSKASSKPVPAKRKHRSSRRGLYMQEGTVDISESTIRETSRRNRASRSAPSPVLPIVIGVETNIKPILLRSNHSGPSQSIAFALSPSPQAMGGDNPPLEPLAVPSIGALLNPLISPANPFAPNSARPDASPAIPTLIIPRTPSSDSSCAVQTPLIVSASFLSPQAADDPESFSILRQFQQQGRRISTTSTEDEDLQPQRSRPKIRPSIDDHTAAFYRPALPSLSALGLGLPQLPDNRPLERRPYTAPVHSAYSLDKSIPPPLSGRLSSGETLGLRPVTTMGRMTSGGIEEEGSFAFGLRSSESP